MSHKLWHEEGGMDYFPLGLATGDAFCNRVDELKHLAINFSHCKPTLIVSPRRYGKTSLVLKAIGQEKYLHAQVDLFSIVSEEDVEILIMKGIGSIVGSMTSGVSKALKLASDFFSDMSVSVSVGKLGLQLEFNRLKSRPADNIYNALDKLDQLCGKRKIKVVLFLDEFQTLVDVIQSNAIESSLRQIAQKSKNIVFVFSGSSRHLLYKIFDDSKRPLYKICDRIGLERISKESYLPFLNQVWRRIWREDINPNVFKLIMMISERHPYYVNLICSHLNYEKVPAEQDVSKVWSKYVIQERSQVAAEISLLSSNQRKLLILIAKEGSVRAPQGKAFASKAKMSSTSIGQSLDVLKAKDYVHIDDTDSYKVIDPLISAALSDEHVGR